MLSTAVSTAGYAVSISTGRSGSWRRAIPSSSMPPIPGMRTSEISRSQLSVASRWAARALCCSISTSTDGSSPRVSRHTSSIPGSSSTTSTRILATGDLVGRRLVDGHAKPDARAAAGLTVERDLSAVAAHQTQTDREAEPGPLALGLGREKRFEHPLLDFFRYAVPRVLDMHDNRRRPVLGRHIALGRDGEAAAVRHGVQCVQEQVEEDLLHLPGVGADAGKRLQQKRFDADR